MKRDDERIPESGPIWGDLPETVLPRVRRPRFRRGALRDLADTMSGMAREAAQLPTPHVRALAPVLDQAERELKRDLANALRHWGPEERFTTDRFRRALLGIRGLKRTLRARTAPGVEGILRDQDADAVELATSVLGRQVAAGMATFGGVVPPRLPLAGELAEGKRMLIRRYRTSSRRYADRVGDDIRRELGVAHARGETFAEMTGRLYRHGGPRGLVALAGVRGERGAVVEMIPEGLFRRYRYWGERLVRTEGMGALGRYQVDAVHELNRTDGAGWLVRWDASMDRKVCKECALLDGVLRAPGRPFRAGRFNSPLHPNCRCSLTPWRAEWAATPADLYAAAAAA